MIYLQTFQKALPYKMVVRGKEAMFSEYIEPLINTGA